MTFVLGVCVAVCVAVSIYLLLGRDLKGVAMGVFLLSHGANLSIIAMSGSPMVSGRSGTGGRSGADHVVKNPPIGRDFAGAPLETIVDPLPQALILTAIVIGFAIMGFLLTLLVVTARSAGTLELSDLAVEDPPDPPGTPEVGDHHRGASRRPGGAEHGEARP